MYFLGLNDGKSGIKPYIPSWWTGPEILDYVNGFIDGMLQKVMAYHTDWN